FLSFLGTNNYVECNYYDETDPENRIEGVKYVQEALLRMYCADFGPDDRYCFFLTADARKMNWEDNGQWNRETKRYDLPNEGLAGRLSRLELPGTIMDVDIPEGFSSEEIWEIFDRVFGCIEAGDEVYLDITHAFRSLPLLGMVLLNYAKVLREARVQGIFYGAFEKLGPAAKVGHMPMEERNAPVLNLLSVSELQDWTNAAYEFTRYGKVSQLRALTRKQVAPILAESRGKDEVARRLQSVSTIAGKMAQAIATNRGADLYQQIDFDALKANLQYFREQGSFIKPLNAIMGALAEKVAPFRKDDPLHWLKSARWCVDHGMYQQAITQLQEGVLTWLCIQLHPKNEFFDWRAEAPRNLLSSVFSIIAQKIPQAKWGREAGEYPWITRVLIAHPFFQELAPAFSSLTDVRNDVNHGGYKLGNAKRAEKVVESCKKLMRKFEEIDWSQPLAVQFGPLLNLSNHPTSSWTVTQMAEAKRLFGEVTDLPFPAVPPDADERALDALVDEYFKKILDINPAAVHVMGEMTFTCRMVQKLKEAGITCLASTTE
ncbi:MAG: TIGR02221 family CRISPR-associated protein, partial [Deltaproteobacteria bacterium]